MSIQLNKEVYQTLLAEDIEMLEKYMPENSQEKKHIIEVLKWSVEQLYSEEKLICPQCKRDDAISGSGQTYTCEICNFSWKEEYYEKE